MVFNVYFLLLIVSNCRRVWKFPLLTLLLSIWQKASLLISNGKYLKLLSQEKYILELSSHYSPQAKNLAIGGHRARWNGSFPLDYNKSLPHCFRVHWGVWSYGAGGGALQLQYVTSHFHLHKVPHRIPTPESTAGIGLTKCNLSFKQVVPVLKRSPANWQNYLCNFLGPWLVRTSLNKKFYPWNGNTVFYQNLRDIQYIHSIITIFLNNEINLLNFSSL